MDTLHIYRDSWSAKLDGLERPAQYYFDGEGRKQMNRFWRNTLMLTRYLGLRDEISRGFDA